MSSRVDVITLFPEMLEGFLRSSIIKKAQEKDLIQVCVTNPRDFARDKHKTCDDKPFGGGSGMVLKPEPIFKAVEKVRTAESKIVLLSPQGPKLNQAKALELSKLPHLILICGHYEGIDERVKISLASEELSIGDYVLTNGALAAAVVLDSVVRLIPGVLGNPACAHEESFSFGLLEYPQYTRPRIFQGIAVPDILLSGNHKKIENWRKQQALEKTKARRPDLLD